MAQPSCAKAVGTGEYRLALVDSIAAVIEEASQLALGSLDWDVLCAPSQPLGSGGANAPGSSAA